MAKSIDDRYTQFFTPDEFKQFNEALDPGDDQRHRRHDRTRRGSGYVRITYVVPGTPADRAGLQVGDVITADRRHADQRLTVDAASKLLRGKAGTIVAVSVARDAPRRRCLDHARRTCSRRRSSSRCCPDESATFG